MRRALIALLVVPVVSACQTVPVAHAAPPRGCQAGAFDAAATLPLPPPRKSSAAAKGQALRFADAVPVGGGVGDIGRWADAGTGWKAWRLRLTSEGAASLSVHLQALALPRPAQLWICAPDGSLRHGPYTADGPAGSGELWSPMVPGGELGLELLAPADRAAAARLRIASAFVGFR